MYITIEVTLRNNRDDFDTRGQASSNIEFNELTNHFVMTAREVVTDLLPVALGRLQAANAKFAEASEAKKE